MRGTLVLTLALLLTPLAGAQSPVDPAAVVAAACSAAGTIDPDVRDQLPVCPREEPAGPAAPGEAAPQAPAAPASPDPREDPAGAAEAVADEVVTAARESVEDPQAAPARLVGLVATLRQFVEDLLGLPGVAFAAVGERAAAAWASFEVGYLEAHDAFADALTAAADASGAAVAATCDAARTAGDAVASGFASLRELFGSSATVRDAAANAPVEVDADTEDATRLVEALTSKLAA